MFSGYEFINKKITENVLTYVPDMSIEQLFMTQKNISNNALALFNKIQVINKPDYYMFRRTVEREMRMWIESYIPPENDIYRNFKPYLINKLNEDFIKSADSLVSKSHFRTALIDNKLTYETVPDNIFHDKFEFSTTDKSGKIIKYNKQVRDMLPQDYQNMDVWKPYKKTFDIDFNKFRSFRGYAGTAGDRIPRHVDRDPNSFGFVHRDPMRASLDTPIYGYDNDEYYKAKGIKN